MKFKSDKTNDCYLNIQVDFEVDEVNQAYRKALRNVGNKVQIPGFRAGKVPTSLLLQHYQDNISKQAVDDLVENSLTGILSNSQEQVVGQPRLNLSPLLRDQPYQYSVEVEIKPTPNQVVWRDLNVNIFKMAEITEEQVNKMVLEQIKAQQFIVPVTDRNEVMPLDYVLVDIDEIDPDDPDNDDPLEKNLMVHVDAGDKYGDLALQWCGQSVPGEVVCSRADLHTEYRCRLKELKHQPTVEPNDELALDCGFENLAAMRASIREQLEKVQQEEFANRLERATIEALLAANPLQIPPTLAAAYTEQRVRSMLQNFLEKHPNGEITRDDYERLYGSQYHVGEQQVQLELVLESLADQQGLSVSDQELEEYIAGIAMPTDDPEAVKTFFRDKKNRQKLTLQRVREKAFKLVQDHVKMLEDKQ